MCVYSIDFFHKDLSALSVFFFFDSFAEFIDKRTQFQRTPFMCEFLAHII